MKDSKKNFWESENHADFLFRQGGPYWHLYTPGLFQQTIFTSEEDFIFGMNLIGRCALFFPTIEIYVHTLMNNHLHFILSGRKELCLDFFARIKNGINTYLYKRGRPIDLDGFCCTLTEIEDLKAIRNEIVYVARNGYLVRKDCTPFSYFWGSGWMYFNPLRIDAPRRSYKSMTIREKREICKSKEIEIPEGVNTVKGMIDPLSYVKITKGEQFFRDAHHYFNLLSKNWEAYSSIAKQIGDNIMISDEELYSVVVAKSLKEFNQKRPSLLTVRQKHEMIQMMRDEYNASVRQISNILNIKPTDMEMLG